MLASLESLEAITRKYLNWNLDTANTQIMVPHPKKKKKKGPNLKKKNGKESMGKLNAGVACVQNLGIPCK